MQILTVEFKYLTRSFVDLLEVKTITAFQEQQNGGENASRECPNCDSKRIVRERLSSRKNTVLLGISKLTINRLKVRSSVKSPLALGFKSHPLHLYKQNVWGSRREMFSCFYVLKFVFSAYELLV